MTKKPTKSNRRLNNFKKILLSDKFLASGAVVFVLIGISLFTVPIRYEKEGTTPLAYATEYKDENGIELGTETVAKEGSEGQRIIRYKYSQSLFDYLFRKDNVDKTEIKNTVASAPENKVVLKGTRKYQYMMCSDGSYRYYTDEQFKERNTGFTSKSPDYCAQFKQGNKVSLADTPKGKSNYTKPSYVPPNCTMIDIPYKTVYQDASWLYVGETQDGYGYNGFKYVCSDGSTRSSYPATDKIVYRGTKIKQQQSYTTEPTVPAQDYAAKRKCDGDYSYAKAQLSIAGASNSSAMDMVNQIYAQCLSRAGY